MWDRKGIWGSHKSMLCSLYQRHGKAGYRTIRPWRVWLEVWNVQEALIRVGVSNECCFSYLAMIEIRTPILISWWYVRIHITSWKYQDSKALGGGAAFKGKVATYDTDGYSQTLHYTKNESLAIIRELKRGRWIDMGTRLVVIDFSMYNANLNLFCVVK